VGDAEDWLAHGVDGLSERSVTLYPGTIVKALNEELGKTQELPWVMTGYARAWER
jgi:hypothetical protein